LVCLPEGKIHVNSPHPREADSTSDSEPGEADGEADGEAAGEAEPRASTAVRREERGMALSCVELERTEAGHFRILLDFHI
jgi:hypothetical protein